MIKPHVGMRVRLSNRALRDLHLQSWEEIDQAREMRIMGYTDINAGSGAEPIWQVLVDKPLINRFILDMSMMEVL